MTLGEAQEALPKNWKLGPTPGGEGSTLVGVFEGKKLLLEIGSYEERTANDKLPPIDLTQKINFIGIVDSRFKTEKGVHVGMLIADAEKQYGKLKSMFNYPHGGEMGEFSDQPKLMNFNFMPKKGSDYTAGIYKPIKDCPNPDHPPSCSNATEYNTGAYISAIGIKTRPPAQTFINIKDSSKRLKFQISGDMEGDCNEDAPRTSYNVWTTVGSITHYQSFEFKGVLPCPEKGGEYEQKEIAYEEQFHVAYGDYNFDGVEDIALRDGMDGGYGSATYQVYLFNEETNKYVNNNSMTALAQYQGMFQVMKKEKMLQNLAKSGCCFFTDERYKVVNNNAVKVYEKITDYTAPGATEDKPKITIKRLIDGKWKVVKE